MHPSPGETLHARLARTGVAGLPAPEVFELAHGRAVAAQFLVRQGHEVAGVSTLCARDANAGHVRAEVLLDPARARDGVAMEAVLLTVNYAFAMWQVRKVYFHSPEDMPLDFGVNSVMVRKEGVLPAHLLVDGEPADLHVFALHRAEWEEFGVPLLRRLVRSVSERLEARMARAGGQA
ncbi:hypothetical protein JOF53_002385 [Crossiella equi]|uniref:N-acetyltransferase domain-containing protein n=1 Tax=Crossiella equi TaxID=130796 RepID=A0ABS5AAA6_9PSEU|nr:GNAT family protein [Crossiella equi]MBP2473513.1 hypothetical protein [Crossiella equi]